MYPLPLNGFPESNSRWLSEVVDLGSQRFLIVSFQTMSKIKGNQDGPGGRNDTYDIGSRKSVPRREVVREVKDGRHPDAHVIEVNRREYVRDNPDNSRRDNVNRR